MKGFEIKRLSQGCSEGKEESGRDRDEMMETKGGEKDLEIICYWL